MGAPWGIFYKGINPIHEDSTLMTSSTPKGPISKYHHTGLRALTNELRSGAGGIAQSMATPGQEGIK